MRNDTSFSRKENQDISILCMGDLCPHGKIQEACLSDAFYYIINEFKQEFHTSDFSLANLECPLTLSEDKIDKDGPCLKADPQTIKLIKACKINIINLSNNHIMDYGREGLSSTLKLLNENEIHPIGAGANLQNASKPIFLEKEGIRIAFLAFCETEFNIATPTAPGCAPMNPVKIIERLEEAKESSDFVILSLHCGSEHYPLPSPRIKSMCRSFVDHGASTIICHHTHIFEGYEVYKGSPIFYGLGNFLFDRKSRKDNPNWYRGFLVRLDLNQNKNVQFKLIPYTVNQKNMTLNHLDNMQADIFYKRLYFLTEIIQDDKKLNDLWIQYSLRQYHQWYAPTLTKCRIYFWKNVKKRNIIQWHYRTNESHHDIITTALAELKNKKKDIDKESITVLNELIGPVTVISKLKKKLRIWI